MRTRPNAFSASAVVSSSNLQASIIGAKIMEGGGNVVDAAIATSAALAVTQNNLCGLGGDMFSLVRMNSKGVTNFNGSGKSFSSADIEFFKNKNFDSIPKRGPLSALTVPGLVDGWREMHRRFGTLELRDLLEPAYRLALDGFPVTHNYSSSISNSAKYLSGFKGWNDIFYRDGKVPLPGSVFRQKDLAVSLKILMDEGLESFYTGSLADKIIDGLKDTGVIITIDDLRAHRTTVEYPLKTEAGGHTIYETAPNSQGATVLLWSNLIALHRRDWKAKELEPSTVIRLGFNAYRKRDEEITDPDFHMLPGEFTSRDYASKIIDESIDLPAAPGISKDQGDTTYFAIADSEGNSVSMIQSNYLGFGSGIIPAGTGFVLQNRGSYFSLDEKHHNALKPRKRTFHTLCAGMMERDGRYEASFGSMGGDIQPQIHVQIILQLMNDLSDPQGVLDMPRWAFPYTIYEKPSKLICESDELYRVLSREFGRNVVVKTDRSPEFGQAQIVTLLENGTVAGGSDARGDGVSIPVLK